MPFNDIVSAIFSWFQKAIPEPTDQNVATQMGVHFEEVAEMVECFTTMSTHAADVKQQALFGLNQLANFLKTNPQDLRIFHSDRIEFLDSLCDQIVTAVGTARMHNMDVVGGLREVNRSNFSKFDEDGNPIFHPQTAKIMKGPNYSPAVLNAFV